MSNYIVKIKRDDSSNVLKHHGIKGQKWGRRRFQEDDGSLTEAGRKRYGVGDGDNDGNKTPNNLLPAPSSSGIASNKKISELSPTAGLEPIKGLIPYTKLAKRDEPDYEDKTSDSGKKSFKPGDDGYEIQDAPKSNSDSKSSETSKAKPDDIYDVKFKDKTGKTKTEKEAEEAHKRGEERKKEAEENRKKEEAEKKKNEEEREKNKKAREKEEEEAHKRGEERKKEAEKKAAEEQKETDTEKLKRLKLDNELHKAEKEYAKNHDEAEKKFQSDIETLNAAKSVANDSSTIARELGNVTGRKSVNVPRLNLSHMTNKEMQDAIQREIIEKQYDQMFNTSRHKAEARKERTQAFFQNVGSAITVTGAALGIAVTVKTLLHK